MLVGNLLCWFRLLFVNKLCNLVLSVLWFCCGQLWVFCCVCFFEGVLFIYGVFCLGLYIFGVVSLVYIVLIVVCSLGVIYLLSCDILLIFCFFNVKLWWWVWFLLVQLLLGLRQFMICVVNLVSWLGWYWVVCLVKFCLVFFRVLRFIQDGRWCMKVWIILIWLLLINLWCCVFVVVVSSGGSGLLVSVWCWLRLVVLVICCLVLLWVMCNWLVSVNFSLLFSFFLVDCLLI